MNNIILFDDDKWKSFLPLSYTRPICELRVGLFTIKEKWEIALNGKASYITQDYLSEKFPIQISSDNIIINSRWLPNPEFISLIKGLEINEALLIEDTLIAARMNSEQFDSLIQSKDLEELKGIDISKQKKSLIEIQRPYDLIELNSSEISKDCSYLGKISIPENIKKNNTIFGDHNIIIEAGAKIYASTLNAENGPIYIGKNVEIMEGSSIRGPFAICDNSKLKMGAKIYGGTTIGPHCKVGGEVSKTIFQGYANKAHDGYIGNSFIGEWCNLGADTNCSNLKNNYGEIKCWDYTTDKFEPSGLQFCGVIMGDHSKSGINTMFNSGTVVGVSCNIFGSNFPRNFIPSFSWGGASGYKTYRIDKALEVGEVVMKRRNLELDKNDQVILNHIFLSSSNYRTWEK